ncbi:MAG: DUF4136 domain-containing protein [Nitrospira sp.]
MKLEWFVGPAAALMLACAGCASTTVVQTKGTQKADGSVPPHVTYAIFPAMEVEKDPAFAQYARLVAAQMNERDYKETEARVAQLGVYFGYGVTESSPGSLGARSPMPAPSGTSTGGSGYGSAGGYGGSMSSSDPSSARRVTSQVVIIVGDLSKSREAGQLVELWRGETTHTGHTSDLPKLVPLLVDATFRHFGESTSGPVQHTFGEEEIKKLRNPTP